MRLAKTEVGGGGGGKDRERRMSMEGVGWKGRGNMMGGGGMSGMGEEGGTLAAE